MCSEMCRIDKVSRPYSNERIFSLALDNYDDPYKYPNEQKRIEGKAKNQSLLSDLEKFFTVVSVKLDENPEKKLPPMPKETNLGSLSNEYVMVSFLKDKETWENIKKHKFVYAPLGLGKGAIHLGSGYEQTKYVLLHGQGERHLFETTGYGPRIASAEELQSYGFNPERSSIYFVFDLKSTKDINISGFNLSEVKVGGRPNTSTKFFTFEELILSE